MPQLLPHDKVSAQERARTPATMGASTPLRATPCEPLSLPASRDAGNEVDAANSNDAARPETRQDLKGRTSKPLSVARGALGASKVIVRSQCIDANRTAFCDSSFSKGTGLDSSYEFSADRNAVGTFILNMKGRMHGLRHDHGETSACAARAKTGCIGSC